MRISLVDNWLSNFKHRIPLDIYLFIVPGVMMLVIALTVIILKASKATVANSVEKLKYE